MGQYPMDILEFLEQAPFLYRIGGDPTTQYFTKSSYKRIYHFVLLDLKTQYYFWNWFPQIFPPKTRKEVTDFSLLFEVKTDLKDRSVQYTYKWLYITSEKNISFEEIFNMVSPDTQEAMLFYLNLFR